MIDDKNFKSGIVSLIGKTNVGKSTLLNTIIGDKVAIISPKVQTTRQSVRGIKTTSRAQIVFLDTPGIFSEVRNKLDQKLTLHAREGSRLADLILFMVTPFDAFSDDNMAILEEIRQGRKCHLFLVINKVDLVQKEKLLPLIEQYSAIEGISEIFPISAEKGMNVRPLEDKIIEYLSPGPLLYDPEIISAENLRFIVSEMIREKVYKFTHQEIPYSSAIKIMNYKETPELVSIEANIYLEKESQKGIVIGNKGSMIKQIGTHARMAIEKFLDKKVFLSLQVKVHKKWRSDEEFLRSLGF